jgi:hypothetical protein
MSRRPSRRWSPSTAPCPPATPDRPARNLTDRRPRPAPTKPPY